MHSLNICEGSCSLRTPLTKQRDDVVSYLVSNSRSLGIDGDDGFNFVAFSQGALLARAVVQKLPPYLRVHTYVSLAGPQRGQWGECNMGSSGIGPTISRKMARPTGWLAFYNPVAQREISVANYWYDPRHNRLFRKEAKFLSEINGYIDLGDLALQRENFLRIQNAIFLGSSDDDCINPPLSSVFEFVDSRGNPTPLKQSFEYSGDTFGLKTMHDEGRLVMQDYPGYDHLSWLRVSEDKKSQFELYVLPHLQ